jgi:cyclophilin family peptidyl-prolyl cis-trans isomerase
MMGHKPVMIKKPFLFTCAAMLAALSLSAQAPAQPEFPAPSEIVAKANVKEWAAIAPSDLLVMDLAPLNGKVRRVVIQLVPAPFSQGWVGNIRKLAAAKWWDGTSINRVQDNYVAQWGDATEKKALPEGLATVPESEYVTEDFVGRPFYSLEGSWRDSYSHDTGFYRGWPIAFGKEGYWPVHCYGMVGVGRNLSPDTGTGAELYTVIGHAPRHLDRNIALVGRVIEGRRKKSGYRSFRCGWATKSRACRLMNISPLRMQVSRPMPMPVPTGATPFSSSRPAGQISAISRCQCDGRQDKTVNKVADRT